MRPAETRYATSTRNVIPNLVGINHLNKVIGKEVAFADDCMKAETKIAAMQNGDVLLLENLRFYAEEEGKVRGIEKGEEG